MLLAVAMGQKARAPVTCMLRVCTYSCAVIDYVVWDFVFKFSLSLSQTQLVVRRRAAEMLVY